MSNNALDQLEQQLERSIENVRQIKIIVSDFQPQGQPGLNQVNMIPLRISLRCDLKLFSRIPPLQIF